MRSEQNWTATAMILGLMAGVILALTTGVSAADPAENLRAIEQLELRAGRVSVTAGTGQYLAPERDNPAVEQSPPVQPADNQQPADSTLPLEPERIAYEQRRPWMLLSRPVEGAQRVRGGWLIHQDQFDAAGHSGFYRSRTVEEASALKR